MRTTGQFPGTRLNGSPRVDGRAVDCSGLENRRRCKPSGGSNPSLPAKSWDMQMSRKEFDASRMRRMKRVAARYGLTILTSEKIKVLGQPGGHALRADESFKVVYGDAPKPFSASLDDIEAYLERLEAGEE